MKKKALFYGISAAIIMVNIIVHVGAAGLLAFGVYQLNSFLGLAVGTPSWKYGLTGVLYLICNAPFITVEVKNTIGRMEVLLERM